MIAKQGLILVLCSALLLMTGCGPDETPPPTVPTATEAATATIAATSVAAQHQATQAPSVAALGAAQTAEQAAAINSYRLRIFTQSDTARGVDRVEIEGAFVKDPPAEELLIRYQDGAQTMASIVVDGVRYMQAGDQWLQTPEAAFSFDELTLITPDDVAGLLSRMTQLGVEEINGLQAVHYRGDKEMIPVVGTPSDNLDVSDLAFAELNLWVDQATNVVTRLILTARDEAGGGELEVHFDYYDFNASIVIQAPDLVSVFSAEDTADAVNASATVPGDALSQLLGFRLLLPTGSSIESSLGTTMVSVLTSYTVTEAQAMVERTLPANGYNLVTSAEPAPGQITYLFQQGSKVVNVTVSDSGGAARIQFVTAP